MHAAKLPNSRLRECEEVGVPEGCATNLAVSTRHKTPTAVHLTRALLELLCPLGDLLWDAGHVVLMCNIIILQAQSSVPPTSSSSSSSS